MSEYFSDSYFTQVLPWQVSAWQQIVRQIQQKQLPHGLLAAGMAGIGKRAFVWRLVAYLLCDSPSEHNPCGQCEQCAWLKAGTHPDLLVLPKSAQLGSDAELESIKIDDIRKLQEFCQTQSVNPRVIVLDFAETLTLGAANALLKTLEEPRSGVFLILISDYPSRLLPTIKSRVQLLPLTPVDQAQALAYLIEQGLNESQATYQLLLADGAVLLAKELGNQAWFNKRGDWLSGFVALYNQQRSPIAASEYWQKELDLAAFCQLSRLMLADVWRVLLGLPSLHPDLPIAQKLASLSIRPSQIQAILDCLDDISASNQQNIQEKFAYDRLLTQFANRS